MSSALLNKFTEECSTYLSSELNTRLLASSSSADKSTAFQHYFTEYQRCLTDQSNFVNYTTEQLTSLDALKSCEQAIDAFTERLKAIHAYEIKQNEIFEQILHELNKSSSSKDERIRLLEQIDELITYKARLTSGDNLSSTNKLPTKSSDTFKNIL